jgi:hypothetical protein
MRHTLTYTQFLSLEKDLLTNVTLNILLKPRVNQVLNLTSIQRAAINARWNKIKEKYIPQDAEGKFLTQNGQWLFLEETTVDEVKHVGMEAVSKAFYAESERFLNNNKITIDI